MGRVFRPNSFHAIYSRDTILHIQDKASLFASFYTWTKPGGRVLISDYCCGHEDPSLWSEHFTQYVKQRGYQLHTVQEYGKLLEGAGYVDVEAIDITDYLVEGWKSKIARCLQGDQRWGLFIAKKPL